jgi:hypothetical protein
MQLKNLLLATDKMAEENVPAALAAFMASYVVASFSPAM